MKVALAQRAPKVDEKEENILIMKECVEKTAADIVVFGELFLTGYKCKNFTDLAEPTTGKSVQRIVKIAKDNNRYIIFGMPEKARNGIYNTAVLVHPNGKISKYRKIFLPHFGMFEERNYFKEGSKTEIFKTKFCKLGLMICYDIFFPEIAKCYALQGAEVLICISASPSQTKNYFERVMQARAIETTTFFLYVNLVGIEADMNFWGGGTVVGPRGDIKVRGEYFKEAIIEYDIDLNEISAARAARPVLLDTRDEICEELLHSARLRKFEKGKR